jgi:hypothetical protein
MTKQTKKLIAIFAVMAITMFAIIKANAEVYPKSKFADFYEVITTPEYDKAVDEYAKLVDEYDSKAEEYLTNPTEEGYKELSKLQFNLFGTEEYKEYRKQGEIVDELLDKAKVKYAEEKLKQTKEDIKIKEANKKIEAKQRKLLKKLAELGKKISETEKDSPECKKILKEIKKTQKEISECKMIRTQSLLKSPTKRYVSTKYVKTPEELKK